MNKELECEFDLLKILNKGFRIVVSNGLNRQDITDNIIKKGIDEGIWEYKKN